jgi:hypothetical protein
LDQHLKPGGLYAIEDWGTGYLDDFPDGRKFQPKPSIRAHLRSLLPRRLGKKMKVPFPCHSYGTVGFVKELVDEQGAAGVAIGRKAGSRRSKFQNVLITSGVLCDQSHVVHSRRLSKPVPAGDGVGKTVISWSTGDENSGKVWVSVNGGKESLSQSHNEVLLPPVESRQGLLMNSAFMIRIIPGFSAKSS